jgi:hypothetical protein
MSEKLATYTFLPWLRQGIVSKITQEDTLAASPGSRERASVKISLQVNKEPHFASRDVQLVGPGDVVGINPQAIVRTEPRNWITDFEPNYLTFVEFYDEDFPWRYTPARAVQTDGETKQTRLRPWIFLMVLEESEIEPSAAVSGPLPIVRIKDGIDLNDIFPPADQAWAWAHVHVGKDITRESTDQMVKALEDLIRQNPDQALSRLVCPRKLKELRGYHVFVIPTFEVGRLAGLGLPTKDKDTLAPSWSAGQREYPIYYQWYFRTGERGDFEYLVRLLEPREVDERVGVRDMDMQDPNFGVAGMTKGPHDEPVMGLEGALKSPQMRSHPASWPPNKRADYPPFLRELEELVNLQDDLLQSPDSAARHPDPIISPPLYGRWHAMQPRLDADQEGWVNQLNRDPRYRVPAGFGTEVIQTHQETYMQKAWAQLGDVLEANQQIRQVQLAVTASHCLYEQSFLALPVDQQIAMTQPVHSRILGENHTTIFQQVKQSRLPLAALNPAFRRILRPRGPVMRKTIPERQGKFTDILPQLNAGDITAAPPKTAPEKVISLNTAVEQSVAVPKWLRPLLEHSDVLWVPLLLLLLPLGLLLMLGIVMLGFLGFVESLRRIRPSERNQYTRRARGTLLAMLRDLRGIHPSPWYALRVRKLLQLMLRWLRLLRPGLRGSRQLRRTLLRMIKELRQLRPKRWYIGSLSKFLQLALGWVRQLRRGPLDGRRIERALLGVIRGLRLLRPKRWYIDWLGKLLQLALQWLRWLRTREWNSLPIRRTLLRLLRELRQLRPKRWYIDWLRKFLQLMLKWLRRLRTGQRDRVRIPQLLLLALLALSLVMATTLLLIIISAALLVEPRLAEWLSRQFQAVEKLREENLTTEAVNSTPPRLHFVLTEPGQELPPDIADPNGADSAEAANFRTALLDLHGRFEIDLPQPEPKPPLDFANIGLKLVQALDPTYAIPKRALSIVAIPSTFKYLRPVETIVPVMAHPVFADPMYKPLRDISNELLIPNLDLIPNNTITLLETNPRFIEAYMVGLNHELARELLWREYPTDQRGSYFRQFWEVREIVNRSSKDPKALEEERRDITELHTWRRSSALGTHENRDLPTGDEPKDRRRLVLVVKGDLLKKYPTAVIYAQKAEWVDDLKDASPPRRKIRVLDESDPAKNLKEPIFKAEIEPDLRFLGFDLTAQQAKGNPKPPPDADDPGWFFVIQERPGEPRFGLDIADSTPPIPTEWNELAWNHLGDPESIKGIDLAIIPATNITEGPDKDIEWGVNAADMAYILYQVPVMVAIHADEMLA